LKWEKDNRFVVFNTFLFKEKMNSRIIGSFLTTFATDINNKPKQTKMKKLFTVLFIAGAMSIVACGPSAEEKAKQEAEAKAKMDSLFNAASASSDSSAVAAPDSAAVAAPAATEAHK
jgi:hypothetical protein